jgi:hypothetical protein
MDDVSYQEDDGMVNRARNTVKGVDHDCNFQCL